MEWLIEKGLDPDMPLLLAGSPGPRRGPNLPSCHPTAAFHGPLNQSAAASRGSRDSQLQTWVVRPRKKPPALGGGSSSSGSGGSSSRSSSGSDGSGAGSESEAGEEAAEEGPGRWGCCSDADAPCLARIGAPGAVGPSVWTWDEKQLS